MATLIYPRASCLRPLTSTSWTSAQSTPARAAFSSRTSPVTEQRSGMRTSRPHPSITRRAPGQALAQIAIRHASSTPATSPTSDSLPPANLLTWDRFFEIRRRKRYINLLASAVTAGATVMVVAPILAQQDIDTWGAQISGIDPIFVLGLSTFAVAAGGWLCGPSFGSGLFGVWAARRGWAKAIQEKEKSFYMRIKRFRADPSSSSPQNPIPDYYGEKVASVKDYRRWLKDQRAFKLKKNKNLF
ncbi:TIM23 complex component [Teratosphaeriaceae sp. CCFEE 6253]|nr:TIM23 complex component [Teratosphaeriaceae sp. CCFEE 6253]